jgi:hypothetical protein
MNKILKSTKELLGVPDEVTDFDSQLVIFINMVLVTLNQFGVGEANYQTTLTDGDLEDFIPGDEGIHSSVQMYIFFKVRLLFDPPSTGYVLAALEKAIAEQEWRFVHSEPELSE